MEENTVKAIFADAWLSISAEGLEEFLRMDCLAIAEHVLVKQLVRWGKFQVESDGDDPRDVEKLRSKILPGLKLIRFAEISLKDFSELCQQELRAVMSADEKSLILKSLTTGDGTLMPTSFDQSASRKRYVTIQLRIHLFKAVAKIARPGFGHTSSFQLHVKKRADFVGLCFNDTTPQFWKWRFTFELKDEKGVSIAVGAMKEQFSFGGSKYFEFSPYCITLAAYTKYTLALQYFCPSNSKLTYQIGYCTKAKGVENWLPYAIESGGMEFIDVRCIRMLFRSPSS